VFFVVAVSCAISGGAAQVESSLPIAWKRVVSTLEPMKGKPGFKICFRIQLVPLHSVFALLLDMYHSYLKSKKKPPKWIVFLVFTFTPSPLVAALGGGCTRLPVA
jgi:hypothetical protein